MPGNGDVGGCAPNERRANRFCSCICSYNSEL